MARRSCINIGITNDYLLEMDETFEVHLLLDNSIDQSEVIVVRVHEEAI